jgi:CRISPR/Cas system-associated exonuclease Cas4 (RecB family)
LKFKFRYVDLIESEEKSAPLAFGSAVHGTIGHYYRRLMEGKLLSADELTAAFNDDFDAQFAVPVKLNGSTPEQMREQGAALIRAYREAVPEPATPIAVEQQITAPVVNILTDEELNGVSLIGILDRVDSGIRPVELKTSAQSYSQLRVDISLQFTIYAYLLAYHYGVGEIAGDFEVIVKTKVPKFQRLETRRVPRDFDRMFRTIDSVTRGIEDELFHPNPSHMFCTGCDYTQECARW